MSLFGASWLCSLCGKDFCPQCYEGLAKLQVRQLYLYCGEFALNQFQGDARLLLLSCISSNGHEACCFMPCSRYTESDLIYTLTVLNDKSQGDQAPALQAQTFFYTQAFITNAENQSTILRIPAGQLKLAEFRYYLAKRIPLVIVGLNNKLQLPWSPSQLIQDYGTDICSLEDCEEKEKPVKKHLKTFLERFMGVESGDDALNSLPGAVWKIKVRA
jgi:hypothetical protein